MGAFGNWNRDQSKSDDEGKDWREREMSVVCVPFDLGARRGGEGWDRVARSWEDDSIQLSCPSYIA